MPPIETQRPYQERFLENFDRSQLRREVEAVRPSRFSKLKKQYASWALGASLAIGGIGTPMAMIQKPGVPSKAKSVAAATMGQELEQDLATAQSIVRQVAGGVEAVADGVQAALPLQPVVEAPQKLSVVTEKIREEFFHTEIPFGSMIYKEAKKNNIRPELVAAVVQAESRFKPTARSSAGAVGLMQLVPRTGRWMGARDLTNPAQNVAAGAKYLRYLTDRFDGNETHIIAAYNAGEGNVKRFGGVPPFRETRSYVSKVQDYERDFKNRVDSRISDAKPVEVAELTR